MLDRLRRWYDIEAWANTETLRSLEQLAAPPEQAVTLMGHLIGGSWLWLGRLADEPEPAAVWPALDLEGCRTQLDALAAAWRGWLESAEEGTLAATRTYTNSLGEPWSSTVEDILVHVLHHSAYHRGQVALLVRAAGGEPAYTDLIHCIRRGFVS